MGGKELRSPPLRLLPFAPVLSFFQFPFAITLLLDATALSGSVASFQLSFPHVLSLLLVRSSFRFLLSFVIAFLHVALVSFFSWCRFCPCLFFVLLLFSFVFHIFFLVSERRCHFHH
jgi:hypothetical protein